LIQYNEEKTKSRTRRRWVLLWLQVE
jgi:hypothetical protein